MAHGEKVEFNWEDGTPKWDNTRKRVWLKWKWYNPYHTPHLTEVLDHFEIQIRYTFKNANGGIETQQKSPESMSDFRDGDFIFDYYWEVPTDCLSVEFQIHAIAKTKSENGGSVPIFEDDPWPAPYFYCGDATVPDRPSAPSVSHNVQIGTQVVLGLDNVLDGENNQNVVQVEFQTVTYDADPEVSEGTIIQNTAKAKVDEFGNARALVYIGNKYGYRFRARLCGVKDKDAGGTIERQIEVFSEWSELSELVLGVPERPSITVRKYTDVVAEYQIKAKNPYNHYQIQSVQTLETFDNFDDWEREYPQFKENSDERTAALQNYGVNERSVESQNGWISNLTSLEAGKAYWRVRSVTAQSDGFYSTWSEPFELTFGEKLRAPIVSMGSQFATLDDTSIQLIIRHNSPNGSPTCRCDIYLRLGAGSGNLPYFDTIRPEDMTVGQNNDGSYTYYYNLNLKDSRINLQNEDTITWYAYTFEGNRSAESVETRSPQSEYVTFWVYETPTIELSLLTQDGESIPLDVNNRYVVPGFPIRLVTSSNLGEKKVVSWNVRIISLANYYNTGRHGEVEVINAGEVLYNIVDVKTPDDLDRLISASDVTLDQSIPYRLEVIAAINTGVTVTAEAEFTMILPEASHLIECAANYNFDNISLGLCPSAWKEEGTGFGSGYPDMDIMDTAVRYSGYGMEFGFTDNNRAFKYNEDTNRITVSSNRENGIGGEGDVYVLVFDAYYVDDPSSSEEQEIRHAPGSIVDYFASRNGMSVEEFNDFCQENGIWITCTKVKTSLNRSDGRMQQAPSVGIGVFDSLGVLNCMMLAVPTLEDTHGGMSEYTPGVEYTRDFETGDMEGIPYMSVSALGVYMDSNYIPLNDYTREYPYVTDGTIAVLISNPEYINANDDAISLGFEYSLVQSITVTAEMVADMPELEPYIGEYLYNAMKEMEGSPGLLLLGNPYTNQNMVTTIEVPTTIGGGGEPTRTLDPNVELAIYRKNEDGTFVTIAENIQNTDKVFVTDPHPNLGGSEYRIVATDTISGKMEFYDPPPYDMKCTDIILQWDETYPDIPFNDDDRDTIRAFGSFLRLPYNIDVSDSANIENSMVNYIGRKNPVSYYGTQTGYTSTWSTEIPKYDKDTIRKLRRLQVWPGDVYVREPNGTGYWAHVTVSFPINHLALTVSVSLNVTRVEGDK